MPSSDYTTTGGGLKLKGAKPAGVDKKRKKKPKPATTTAEASQDQSLRKALEDEDESPENRMQEGTDSKDLEGARHERAIPGASGKTEAERRHEERRRKRVCLYSRYHNIPNLAVQSPTSGPLLKLNLADGLLLQLDERLKREGVKTHKERVEELNKYLSNLSEHHDMPRIGPG